MKMWFSAGMTALLILSCFNVETLTPGWVALALFAAFCLGGLWGIEAYRSVEAKL